MACFFTIPHIGDSLFVPHNAMSFCHCGHTSCDLNLEPLNCHLAGSAEWEEVDGLGFLKLVRDFNLLLVLSFVRACKACKSNWVEKKRAPHVYTNKGTMYLCLTPLFQGHIRCKNCPKSSKKCQIKSKHVNVPTVSCGVL
jgi:hypothetical protein